MDTYNIDEAKSRFSELVDRVEAGDTVEIMRCGKLVARLSPAERSNSAEPAKKKFDIKALRALTDGLPMTREVVREMRDAARY